MRALLLSEVRLLSGLAPLFGCSNSFVVREDVSVGSGSSFGSNGLSASEGLSTPSVIGTMVRRGELGERLAAFRAARKAVASPGVGRGAIVGVRDAASDWDRAWADGSLYPWQIWL